MEENRRVLIIEDEQIIAMHLEAMLKKSGYEVVGICSEGKEAIDKCFEKKPDLLFVDIVLDGELTGIDVVKAVKEKRDLPIIYLTSNTDETTVDKAKETNPTAFLKKPFDEGSLKATIDISLHRFYSEKEERDELKKRSQLQEMNIQELTETNSHLITATWRERELKNELEKTKQIIEKQNENILASINYAKRIQKAIIPTKEYLDTLFEKYFVFYKPKDVVSGDFPWIYERGEYIYFGAVDCTGHGVPGAMMSLIGCLLLNDIVNNQGKDKTPSEILNELHTAVVKTLKQDAPGNKAADGMDIAMCRIDKKNKEVVYAGAHRPLYHLTLDKTLDQHKGCKYPVGGMQYDGENHFKDHFVTVKEGESIYFFSDGLPDQFGGPENLKLGPKRIRQLISDNAGKSMPEMEKLFDNQFENWKGEGKQVDDVLLIGIEF